ncbi:MAG: hypothetical protein ACTHM6_15210 [Tepidisphaeraceae bacterium]
MTNPLDYESPAHQLHVLNTRFAIAAGSFGGLLTVASFFLLVFLTPFFAMLVGAVVSAVAAAKSPGSEYRAGLLASSVCTLSTLFAAGLCSLFVDHGPIDPIGVIRLIPVWWAVFALPGMLGSLWSRVGNRLHNHPRQWTGPGRQKF